MKTQIKDLPGSVYTAGKMFTKADNEAMQRFIRSFKRKNKKLPKRK